MTTMQTGCITGGVKKNSGVEVDEHIATVWAEIRDDSKPDTDWLICGFDSNTKSKNRITLLCKGSGGIESCSSLLIQHAQNCDILFGGAKLLTSGRFVSFMYMDLNHAPIILRGRAGLFKNGVLNVLEGCDCVIEMHDSMTEREAILLVKKATGSTGGFPDLCTRKIQTNQCKTSKECVSMSSNNFNSPTIALMESNLPLEKNFGANHTKEDVIKDKSTSTSESTYRSQNIIVSYQFLQSSNHNELIAAGVDIKHKEMSLSDSDFQNIIGMNKALFSDLPKWKQTQKKKNVGLF